jgi:predicted  nucleic acid-binding Zn-ribbon protein
MDQYIANQLLFLSKLQAVDSELYAITKNRDALPNEIKEIQSRLDCLHNDVINAENDLKIANKSIADFRTTVKEKKLQISRYEKQQSDVRNNREYDAISKEIELQDLEIQLMEKKIKEALIYIAKRKSNITEYETSISELKQVLELKESQLGQLLKESELEETELNNKRVGLLSSISENNLNRYKKIREHVRNGLAVVNVKNEACCGCYIVIPTQRQIEISYKQDIVTCEHCGRIIADVELDMCQDDITTIPSVSVISEDIT